MNRRSSRSNGSRFERFSYTASLALLAVMAATLVHVHRLTAQVSDDGPVVYYSCDHFDQYLLKRVFGPDAVCGTDEAATQAMRHQQAAAEANSQAVEARQRELTSAEQQQVEAVIDEQFAPARSKRQQDLLALTEATRSRLEALSAESSAADDGGTLTSLIARLESLQTELSGETLASGQLSQARDALRSLIAEAAGLQTVRPRDETEGERRITNIKTRVQDLVAELGTYVAAPENRSAADLPVIAARHDRLKQMMRRAEDACSMRRPQSCSILHDVLDELGSLQGPVCRLPRHPADCST